MTRDDIIQAWRTYCAGLMGVASLSESGNGEALSASASPFACYRVRSSERIWGPTSIGLAALDNPIRITLDVFYCQKKASASESLSVIRNLQDQWAASMNGEPPAWDTSGTMLYCRVLNYTEGSGDEYSSVFAASDTWAAGSMTIELLFCL